MLSIYSIEYTTGTVTMIEFTEHPNMLFVIEDLLNGTEYSVRVAVNNSAGLGDYSSPPVVTSTNIVGQCPYPCWLFIFVIDLCILIESFSCLLLQ